MKMFEQSRKNIYSFLILLILNIKISNQIKTFDISFEKEESNLGVMNIDYNDNITHCEELVPSLFSPLLLIFYPKYNEVNRIDRIQAFLPLITFVKNITFYLFDFNIFEEEYDVILGLEKYSVYLKKCYFGLLSRIGNFYEFNESHILINRLKEQKKINQKIFSFDKWKINEENIKTTLFLGDEHEIFKSKNEDKDGIIGSCKIDKDYTHWGCSFKEISINNITVDLLNENNNYYKIYFSSESHTIMFPKSFYNNFTKITKGQCIYDDSYSFLEDYFTMCNKSFFNSMHYAPLELRSEDMIITLEIDNQKRFLSEYEEKGNLTNIRFENIDYFIFPLIMFKQFLIQFDAENDMIKFYTKDKEILKVKEKKKAENSSNGTTVFLIILIIILIIAIGFGGFWFIKKRRGSIEKNINKYNKFDEDENFQNMNEKRVF